MPVNNPFDSGFYNEEQLRQFGFAAVGKNVKIAKDCTIVGLNNITIGDNVRIDSKTTIIALQGQLKIGSYVHIAGNCYINSQAGVTFEDFSAISFSVLLFTANDDFSGRALTNPTVPEEFKQVKRGPITLEKHAIVGAGSVILPNVTIGEGSAVGALSLVTKSIPGWEIHVGFPCRFLQTRVKDLLTLEKNLLKF